MRKKNAPLLEVKINLSFLKYIPLHLLFWVLVWVFYVYFFGYASQREDFAFTFAATLLPITIAATYTFAYYLVPRFLVVKRYFLFILYGFYTLCISLFVVLIITFFNLIFLSDFQIDKMPLLTRNVVFVMIMVYLVVGIVSFVKLLSHNLQTTNRNQELENKLLEGQLHLKQRELHYLKQQIHPHFLFNTLNTVYGFALKESKQTPDLILKLSDLLDYILNQIDKPTVPIQQEIKHLEAYIGLEEIRFRDMLDITFTKEVTHDSPIPPMLFTAFVENAFKHGSQVNGKLKINIILQATASQVLFEIENTRQKDKETKNHGLGITNTRKRLETLYPNNYNLKIDENDTTYKAILNINFTDDV